MVTRSTGSWTLAVDLAGDDLGLADGELEALAAHHLDQHRELQLASALHLPRVGRSVVSTRSDTLPTSSASRRLFTSRAVSLSPSWPDSGDVLIPIVIDRLGSSTWMTGKRARIVGVGERLADGDVGQAGDGDDLARADFVRRRRGRAPR